MQTRSRTKRRAYLLIETAMAGLLVALGMAMTMTLLAWTVSERRMSERRGWAAQEVANLMERLTTRPFRGLDTASVQGEAKLSTGAATMLPGAAIAARIRDEPPLKRIEISLTWTGPSGRSEPPVRLMSWVADKETPR